MQPKGSATIVASGCPDGNGHFLRDWLMSGPQRVGNAPTVESSPTRRILGHAYRYAPTSALSARVSTAKSPRCQWHSGECQQNGALTDVPVIYRSVQWDASAADLRVASKPRSAGSFRAALICAKRIATFAPLLNGPQAELLAREPFNHTGLRFHALRSALNPRKVSWPCDWAALPHAPTGAPFVRR